MMKSRTAGPAPVILKRGGAMLSADEVELVSLGTFPAGKSRRPYLAIRWDSKAQEWRIQSPTGHPIVVDEPDRAPLDALTDEPRHGR